MSLYFAYGANMDPMHMAERCPGSVLSGLATLENHRFAIAAGGFGTVLPEPGARVCGVLWRLTAADRAALDEFERVEEGLYASRVAEVRDQSGERVDAMLYYATDSTPGVASPGYLEQILDVGEELGFPSDYLDGLRSHKAP